MRFGLAWILAALAVGVPAEARAQTTAPASEVALSAADRTAIAGILDALTTQKGDALTQAVVNALNKPGVDAQAVARAVKVAAGTNLPGFQSILVQTCLSGGSQFCKLAAIQAPNSQQSDVTTAATGSGEGAGAGGGGGFGGTPQTNGGHYGGSPTSGSLFNAASLDQTFQNSGQSFGSLSGSGGRATTLVAAANTSTLSTPGPVAGSGPSVIVIVLAWSIWRQRRHSAIDKSLVGRAFR